jgi:quercetin dioxygenase-like cupin family protein
MEDVRTIHKPILVSPDAVRDYPMGRMRAVFKADTEATAGRYLEWVARTAHPWTARAPPPEDHVFYVIAGTLSISFNEERRDAAKGAYVVIP